MLQKPFVRWLIVLIAILGVGFVVRVLLASRELYTVAFAVDIAGVVLTSAWCYFGLFKRWDRQWARVVTVYLAGTNFVYVASMLAMLSGRDDVALALGGFWGLVLVGLAGIARTVIQQAARVHITEGLIVVVVLLIIGLPSWLEENRIDYRLTFYLTWSLRLSIFALSVVTAVLAAFTITYDLTRKQMFMLAAKPVGRFSYLLGKWLGLVLLNVVFVSIVGLGVWLGAMLIYTAPLPENAEPETVWSQTLARTEVLTARVVALPQPASASEWNAMLKAELAGLHRELPQIWPENVEDVPGGLQGELRGKVLARWHSIPPGAGRIYRFDGFSAFRQTWQEFMSKGMALRKRMDELIAQERREEAAAVRAEMDELVKQMPVTSLRLRFRPKFETPPPNDLVHMVMQLQNYREALTPMVNDSVREKPIPYQFIDEDGSVTITLYNVNAANPQLTHNSVIKLVPNEGLQLIYEAGTFEGNIVASMVVHWVRLAFLAMVGLTCGTFLGFPMAVLFTLFIYSIASLSGYAGEALAFYTSLRVEGKSWWDMFVDIFAGMWTAITELDFGTFFKLCIKLLGDIVLFIVPSFSRYNPTSQLANGRAVDMSLVGNSLLYVGVVWTGAVAFIGWLVFRKKELAKVTV